MCHTEASAWLEVRERPGIRLTVLDSPPGSGGTMRRGTGIRVELQVAACRMVRGLVELLDEAAIVIGVAHRQAIVNVGEASTLAGVSIRGLRRRAERRRGHDDDDGGGPE